MKENQLGIIVLFVMLSIGALGQGQKQRVWYNAAAMPIHGKLQEIGTTPFERFPKKLKKKLREPVWELSRNSAGLYIDFQTTGTDIVVRYGVENEIAFPHMPATGVSGIDLYARDEKPGWKWLRGVYAFSDTISYRFSGIKSTMDKNLRTYRLYLPLYNTVEWLQIGVFENSVLKPGIKLEEEPIVIYGTSIVQGACASRPGLAWPNILGKRLQREVINLGFSGNGRLEPEIIDFMTQIEASIYVLDCMANFTSGQGLNPKAAEKRIVKAVNDIRATRPNTPILLVEHAGYSDGAMQPSRRAIYVELNQAMQRAYAKLNARKVKSLYLLKKEEIGLKPNGFVDGTHPNDHGMLHYADAYAKKIMEVDN